VDYGVLYTMTAPGGTVTFNRFADREVYMLQALDGLDSGRLRTTIEVEAQRDGIEVFDAFDGEMVGTFEGVFVPTDVESRERMRGSLVATLRSARRGDGSLVWSPPGQPERFLTFRMFDKPSTPGDRIKRFLFQLVASGETAGGALGTELKTVDTTTLGAPTSGWSFPFTFPFSFGDVGSDGTATAINAGTSETFPIVKIFGTLRQPIRIRNETTDKVVSLPALDVISPDFVQIDMRTHEVTLNGDPGSSLFGEVDLDVSEFWTLIPLVPNFIRLTGNDPDEDAKATIIWRDGF
jgi:hypothetical protein